MQVPNGYMLTNLLRRTARSEVFAAVRQADGQAVVLKTQRTGQPSDVTRLRAEFEGMSQVAGPGTALPIELIDGGEAVLVQELLPGRELGAWLEDGRPSVRAFLEVAIALAEILDRIHRARILHCDLSASNILVDRDTLRASIVDFGMSRRLGQSARLSERSWSVRGELGTATFAAPEQTGRMNRGMDARSDLYSLGAVLYFAATGEPPFVTTDVLALIHAHLAIVPDPPRARRPDLPEALSRIIVRLLRKEPEERYQSAASLAHDLRTCRAQLDARGEIDDALVLGSVEAPQSPRFSRRIHGREAERAVLRETLEQAATGCTQTLWLRGPSGCGKSALVDDLQSTLGGTLHYLACGKFDPYRDQAYGAWRTALEAIAQQILLESEARLDQWKARLREALGSVAGALLELVPDLRFVLGEVAAVPAQGPREAQARLSLAVQRFLGACATADQPVVLFLDDVQWGDEGSLQLLESLLMARLPVALLVVGAYRSDEAEDPVQLIALQEKLQRHGVTTTTLEIGPLSRDALVELLSETLDRRPDEVAPLAAIVEQRTEPLPLLVRQFVEMLHARGLLCYEPGRGWRYDLDAVSATDVPDGALAFMLARLDRLRAETRALTEVASCVGDHFDVELLVELGAGEHGPLERLMFELSEAGLVGVCPRGWRFTHDRIREAAQKGMSEDERARLHLQMARILLSAHPDPASSPRLLEIASHLNLSLAVLPAGLRFETVRVNLAAGKRLLGDGAAAAGDQHLRVGVELLRGEDWDDARVVCFDLYLHAAGSAFQTGAYSRALDLLDVLDRHVESRLELTRAALERIQVLAVTEKPETCVRYTLSVLRRLGVRWPLHPSRLRAALALRSVQLWLRGRDPAVVMRPAPQVDLDWLAPMLVVSRSGGMLIRFDVRLTALASCFVLRRYLRRGYVSQAPFSLASYANWMQIILGASAVAKRIGESAARMNEAQADPQYGPRCDMQLHGMLAPWLTSRRQALAPLEKTSGALLELGDVEFAYYARFLKVCYSALAGDPLREADRALKGLVEFVVKWGLRVPEPEQCAAAYGQLLADTRPADLEATLATSVGARDDDAGWAEPFPRTFWLMVLCVYGRFDLAWREAERAAAELDRCAPFVHVADHVFYRGLAAAALASAARGRARRRYRRALRESTGRLRGWAKGGPDFVHMAWLLDAERARLGGSAARANALYRRAAERAAAQSFIHHAAIACERRSHALTKSRRFTEANVARADARAYYQAWGARGKARELSDDPSEGTEKSPS